MRPDVYTLFAAKLFDVPIGEVDEPLRDHTKKMVLAGGYGADHDALFDMWVAGLQMAGKDLLSASLEAAQLPAPD